MIFGNVAPDLFRAIAMGRPPSVQQRPHNLPAPGASLRQPISPLEGPSPAKQPPAPLPAPGARKSSPIFGKLTWQAIPFQEPIPLITSIVVIIALAAIAFWITRIKAWPFLWHEYFTSTDHKKIGIMYIVLGLVMLVRGFADAIMMRAHQFLAIGPGQGFLTPEHYNQIFSAHGVIMIFFVAMPLIIGFMNFVVPLQLGVRDVAFPTLNNVSFWLSASGALLINLSLFLGEFARTGWLAFPPLSEKAFSPGVGVDYYLIALQISGVGTTLTAVNFVTTILKIRAPGMSYMRMPVFCWTSLASSLLMLAAFPVLTATLALLMLDRYLGFHFFTNDGGGNSMLYMNLIWVWGHPEVYILVLPAFGIYSEIASTFSGKPLFGYRSMVFATLAICILSFTVWLHHFFTMGAGANVNAVFGIASMLIGIPTGVKIFNWLFTMYGGRVRFTVPMHYLIGFMLTVRRRRPDRRAAGDAAGRLRRPQQPVPGRPLPPRDHSAASCSRCSPATPTGSPRRSASRSTSGSARPPSGAGSSASTSPSCQATCSASGAARAGCSTSPTRPGSRGSASSWSERCSSPRASRSSPSSCSIRSGRATSGATSPATRGTAARSNG